MTFISPAIVGSVAGERQLRHTPPLSMRSSNRTKEGLYGRHQPTYDVTKSLKREGIRRLLAGRVRGSGEGLSNDEASP